jgi:hypothetical protein
VNRLSRLNRLRQNTATADANAAGKLEDILEHALVQRSDLIFGQLGSGGGGGGGGSRLCGDS